MMHLKIAAPGGTIFDGEITKLTIPTEEGEITVLEGHQPLSAIVKPGVLSFGTNQELSGESFTLVDGKVHVSVSKGLLLVDGKSIVVTTSAATSSVAETAEVLEKMKADMEVELEKIRDDGNAEDLEKAIENMEKVQADIKLVKLRGIQ